MTVDRGILAARMATIRVELARLRRLERLALDEFLASIVQQHAAERELQIVIEACLDIGHHVISREGLRRPGDYRDVFTVLREAHVLDDALGRRLENMAGFRNRLVHGYLDVDPRRVFDIARDELGDVEEFLAAIVRRYDLDRE